ncbi:uncharacterized protein LACBIDRAFT_331343 [Laccaria bicolor S238N-H82]|uniref:Predicted protein n=1 Tax=Laccaria bicolor (strain S238N-H82 / ATCC MYA-4686) TaxID=486041 RepID=B0DP73_LACBS|nr:uncharacterized protein LACBIDRAFT_331343 [Laccaria bicolor S238N-H82]EDR03563.1 predicted protein [Laccaria bicolor S238N-H82]|eukprot:XP_001885711.1 predicted protein [Laccaria bicolor S238N-H82]
MEVNGNNGKVEDCNEMDLEAIWKIIKNNIMGQGFTKPVVGSVPTGVCNILAMLVSLVIDSIFKLHSLCVTLPLKKSANWGGSQNIPLVNLNEPIKKSVKNTEQLGSFRLTRDAKNGLQNKNLLKAPAFTEISPYQGKCNTNTFEVQ